MILTRIALDHLDRPASAIEYLALDGSWKRGLNWRDARVIIDHGHTEMSVRYHATIGKWIAVQQNPGLGGGVGFRRANRLQGPWSSLKSWSSMPETPPSADNRTFCYAAKEHVEFARSGEMVITYLCSSFDFTKLVGDMRLYRPQVVRVPLKR